MDVIKSFVNVLHTLANICKIGMFQSLFGSDPLGRVDLQQFRQQIQSLLVQFGTDFRKGLSRVLLEFVGFPVREFNQSWVVCLVRRAHYFKDFLKLVTFVAPCKQGLQIADLSHDAPNAPHVDHSVVLLVAQEHVRRTVPQSHNLVGLVLHWDPTASGQSEVSQLEYLFLGNQQVLRFQVSVQNFLLVAHLYSFK